MATMIMLKLFGATPRLEDIEQLPGLNGLALDHEYGVVPVNPAAALFVVRTDSPVDQTELRCRQSPEIAGFYGGVPIAPVAEPIGETEGNLQQREDWFKHQSGR